MTLHSSSKGYAILLCRARDLILDGYCVKSSYRDAGSVIYKLEHKNGNVILLSYNNTNGRLCQRTNGKVTHQQTMR